MFQVVYTILIIFFLIKNFRKLFNNNILIYNKVKSTRANKRTIDQRVRTLWSSIFKSNRRVIRDTETTFAVAHP